MIHDVLHALVGQFTEPQLQHQHVCVVDQVQARDVRQILGVDLAGLRILAEQDDRFVAVTGQQPAEHGEAFLRSILLVARDEYDASTVARLRVGVPLEHEPAGVGFCGDRCIGLHGVQEAGEK